MSKAIQTTLHYYCFNIHNADEKTAWEALKEKLADILPRQMHSHSFGNQPITFKNTSETVQLETSCLFDNQWNEAADGDKKGRRLFDWYLEYRLQGKHIKQGHWLEQNQEMKDIRDNTKKCGYCGHMTTEDNEFCAECIGSPYLEEKDLYLTRYRPVSERPRLFPKLTEREKALLIPMWETAQGLGKISREAAATSKARQKVAALVPDAEKKAAKLLVEAQKKKEAYTWLLDNKFRCIGNVIHYNHKDTFCFGWSKPYSKEEKAELTELLKDFPFKWEFDKK